MAEKTLAHVSPRILSDGPDSDSRSQSSEDRQVMEQMGKLQQLKRRFNVFSIFGLSITLLSSWEALGMSLGVSMTAGGSSSLIYGLIFTFMGSLACAASIAEMASMCPISGAQMHWSYMFAPKELKVVVSFIQGQLQGIVKLNNPGYVIERWHTTLIMWAIVLVAYLQHMWTIKLLPVLEMFMGTLHILMFLALFLVMLIMGRNASAEFVFTGFVNQTGWKSNGVAWFVGLLPAIFAFVGFDGAIHLSEETERSAHVIPKVIIWTVLINGPMAWIFAIICLFGISDFAAVLHTSTGYPLIEILLQTTRSRASATAIMAFILTTNFGAMFGDIASVSRLTWAFARDDGLPFSNYFKRIETDQRIPVRAVNLFCGVILLLSLINIGSTVALNAILSLTTISLYASYIIPIACLISMRLRVKDKIYNSEASYAMISEELLIFGPWNLGKWAATMNYAGPIFLFVLCFASVDYLVRGRYVFVGPRKEA
ncbi:hypothetical protein SNOG_10867 [Parastagonospora nodorum SN15]|uniref:Amino acid permease/ SLC12A domain-containing protein n=1 Tax=Phaeosphaeria nodorum (strain SN15 / ATCC MYA-4574 / FGSC 10173) TaxID=321614 RepID=Q0UBJ7_PHANO|nr:hypothetical protein SNOG_10867 [Parastagonospora nodorum SN15]EAT81366.2 hypothetical protein SNOG_10867 [Parastagonospora nodorum SN15]